jgi:hypothetical protein
MTAPRVERPIPRGGLSRVEDSPSSRRPSGLSLDDLRDLTRSQIGVVDVQCPRCGPARRAARNGKALSC